MARFTYSTPARDPSNSPHSVLYLKYAPCKNSYFAVGVCDGMRFSEKIGRASIGNPAIWRSVRLPSKWSQSDGFCSASRRHRQALRPASSFRHVIHPVQQSLNPFHVHLSLRLSHLLWGPPSVTAFKGLRGPAMLCLRHCDALMSLHHTCARVITQQTACSFRACLRSFA